MFNTPTQGGTFLRSQAMKYRLVREECLGLSVHSKSAQPQVFVAHGRALQLSIFP